MLSSSIKDYETYFFQSIRQYQAQNPQADIIDTVFRANPLLSIQKDAGNSPNNNQSKHISSIPFNWKP